MAATPNKDTIYIDIDDEITAIIDKLNKSAGKVVALVLPKRASVLQSIVNMKLLKRAADESKKHVVLITSEAGLLPLAGMAGVHVAKTLTSAPEIPMPPTTDDSEETVNEDSDGSTSDSEITAATAGSKPVGELAGLPPELPAAAVAADGVETLELDDDEADDEQGSDAAAGTALATKDFKPTKVKKDKKLKIPNFDRFRLLLILGVLIIIVLIIGAVAALSILPKATIAVTTDATNINTNLTLSLDTQQKTLDPVQLIVPATSVTQAKTYTEQAPTTGEKNEGNKASGTVTITNCTSDGSEVDVPAGSGVSENGQTFITQEAADLVTSFFKGKNGPCQSVNGTTSKTVDVIAQTGGSAYNIASGVTMSVADYSDTTAVSASTFTGGTDNNVQVVSQTDIDNAKAKIVTADATVKTALTSQLTQENLYPITTTFSSGTPAVTTSSNVGDTASTITVTEVITYTLLGVHESDLQTLVDNSLKGQIDSSKQSILSEGLNAATFTINNTTSDGAQLTMQTTATAGPQLSVDTIKSEVAGKKSGDVETELKSDPDVTNVTVKLSPFFVTTVPKKASKITVTIAKPTITSGTTNTTAP